MVVWQNVESFLNICIMELNKSTISHMQLAGLMAFFLINHLESRKLQTIIAIQLEARLMKVSQGQDKVFLCK
jgi:hypothetical protein